MQDSYSSLNAMEFFRKKIRLFLRLVYCRGTNVVSSNEIGGLSPIRHQRFDGLRYHSPPKRPGSCLS